MFGNVNTDVKSSIVKNGYRKKPKNPTSKTDQGFAFVTQGRSPADQMDHSSSSPSSPTKPAVRCPLCEASHWLTHCELFKAKSFEERHQLARKKGLCENCLRSGHMAHDCPKESLCQVSNCKFKHRKHSTFLHPKSDSRKPQDPPASDNVDAGNSRIQAQNCFVDASESVCSSTGARDSTSSLPVVPVKVKAKGKETIVETYAFLDPGLNTSFCTDQLIDRLGTVGKKTTLSLTTIDNENVKSQSLVVSLEVCDLSGNNAIELPCVFSRAKLPVSTDDIPCQSDMDRWTYLEGIQIPHIDAEIDLLIGNDVPEVLKPKEVKESRDGGPYAVRTLFEWTMNGPLGRMSTSTRTANRIQSSSELNVQFEKFCEMKFNDSQFSIEKTMPQEDRKALSMMEQSVRLRDGHYE